MAFEDFDEPQHHRGFQKGQVVEIWGPPASGKTTFAYGHGPHISICPVLDAHPFVVCKLLPILYETAGELSG